MSDEATIVGDVFKSLLAHFWFARDNNLPKLLELYPKGYLISYGQLVEKSGVPIDPRHAGGPLFHIAEYCEQRHWPPINSLVVRGKEKYPGDGFFAAPGSVVDATDIRLRMEKWVECAHSCMAFNGYPRSASELIGPY